MRLRSYGVLFACLVVLGFSILSGCSSNTLNPLCGSARPAPAIGSLSPSTMSFADVQQGSTLTVNGSSFVSATQLVINSTPLAATVVSAQQMKVKVSTDVIPAPGAVKVMAQTPSGNSGDLGCTSGGKSSVLTLTVN